MRVVVNGLFLMGELSANHRSDAAAVPVEAQHATEGLEPPGVGQSAKHLSGSELLDDRHRHRPGKLVHPLDLGLTKGERGPVQR